MSARARSKKLFCEGGDEPREEWEETRGGGEGWNYNTALQVEAIEKPVWLKGSGLERIRDASYRHIEGWREGWRYETAARVARPRWKRERGKRERRERLNIGAVREYIVALISIGILGCKSNFIAMNGIEKWGALTMVRFRIQFVNTI